MRRRKQSKLHKKLNIILTVVILLFFVVSIGPKEVIKIIFDEFNDSIINSNDKLNNNLDYTLINDDIDIKVYFTQDPSVNITQIIIDKLNNSNMLKCAFYELNKPELLDLFEEKQKNNNEVKLIIDNHNIDELENHDINFMSDTSSKLMHNKFCLLDNNTILTGSMNPTKRGIDYNNNNLIFIKSKSIFTEYENEFIEMENNIYQKGERSLQNKIIDVNNELEIQVHFCPEDNCQTVVLNELNKVQDTVRFMTFSFTDIEIRNLLLDKINNSIDVIGIFEKTQAGSKYSSYNQLSNNSIKDKNKYNMHHKVFIIDDNTVITGSYNPSKNGNTNNDENLVIIKNKLITEQFIKEFNKLYY